MGCFGGCGNDSCLWIIVLIILISCCCNNNNGCGEARGGWNRGGNDCGCGCGSVVNNGCCCD